MDDAASSPRGRERNGSVCVLEPGPYLEVTVEPGAHDDAELHLHPAGQGFWIARIAARLGADVTLVAPFGGETGRVLEHLIPLEGMRTARVVTEGANGSVVHDRRAVDNEEISVPGPQLVRHDRDDLHGAAFSSALNADVFVLAGSRTPLFDTGLYEHLAHDVRLAMAAATAGVLRHGLASAQRHDIERLAERVTVTSIT